MSRVAAVSVPAGAASSVPPGSDTTVVCCVESGPLEHQTVRLVASLRRWGGSLARAPVLAVTPRFGPPLLSSTAAAFDAHGVEHVRLRARSRYAWQHYMNKPLALVAAVERASTPTLAWFDSDILVVAPPEQLTMAPVEDFVACARDRGTLGSTGAGDPNEAYWERVCAVAGLRPCDLPWVCTEEERTRIRMYWNSGLFAFRRQSPFAEDYLRLNVELLDARVGSSVTRLHYNDQVALGLSMVRSGMRWRALPHSHNYGVSRWHADEPSLLADARIIHYHDSLAPDFFPELVRRLEVSHVEVGGWLRRLGPLPSGPPLRAAVRHLLRAGRGVERRRFYRTCRWV